MQNKFHPATTQKSMHHSKLLKSHLNLISVLGFVNQRVQDDLITSPYVPSWLARSFGTVHGRLTYWYYASGLCHEPAGPRHFLALLLAPGNMCLDIGASDGVTARIARVAVGPRGRVYAFEPQWAVFEKLGRTKERFGWDNVIPVQCLVQLGGNNVSVIGPAFSRFSGKNTHSNWAHISAAEY